MLWVKTHVTLAVLERIFGINPACSSPISRKACTRSQVDDIENRGGVIQGIRTRIAHIFGCRVYRIDRIAGALGVIVKAVVKVIVELFQITDERAVFVSLFVFVQFKGKQLATHAVLDIRNFTFHHVRNQVVVLASLHRKALVRAESARISQLRIRLLVQNRFGIERLVFTNAPARNE